MHNPKYAEIAVDNKSSNVDKLFTYLIPEEHKDRVKIGIRVLVPFGFGNKLIEGIVINLKNKTEFKDKKLKYIHSIIDTNPVLSENMIKLALWMKDKYLAQHIDVFRTIMPTGISKKVTKLITLKDNINEEDLLKFNSQYQKNIIEFLIDNGPTDIDVIKKVFNSKSILRTLKTLEEREIIEIHDNIYSNVDKKYEKYVCKNFQNSSLEHIVNDIPQNAIKQRQIIEYITENEAVRLKDLMVDTSCSLSSIKSLEQKGYIKVIDKEVKRNPLQNKNIEKNVKPTLTPFQEKCVNTIYEDITHGRENKFLIHGVTGSGKTEVYLRLIEKMLELNKDSIVLVPEISLTPQTVERFVGRFGERVAVLHSRLSLGERYDEWRRIREGSVQIVVGARSAIFAPFNNLGLIIIDEEHETSYKSSMNPKYNAIEVAQKRCELEGASLILGSATPSIETYYKAKNGHIKLLTMTERVNKRPLPPIEIVDMKEELDSGNKSIFSKTLYEAIEENLNSGKQTILFLNRRGFSTFVSCRKCGYVAKCKSCDISLTYHITDNFLKCHYCGTIMRPPKTCPECGSKYIKYFGIGTQKVEEIVKKAFPKARVARMDVDTTSRKGSHEKILSKVKNGEVDILIGTQMISKGLDFPNVTLVGIIAADISLNLPDFRSSERTFQLTTQVSGRAGRGMSDGRVILQTYEPEHYSIETSKDHDYISFYNKEILIRKEFNYPPFVNLVSIVMTSKNEKKLSFVSDTLVKRIVSLAYERLENFDRNNILGPNPAPISKIRGNYRWHILIKGSDVDLKVFRGIINDVILNNLSKNDFEGIKFSIDINPISIL